MKKYLSTKLLPGTINETRNFWSILFDEDGGSVTMVTDAATMKSHGIPKNFRNFETITVSVKFFACSKFCEFSILD